MRFMCNKCHEIMTEATAATANIKGIDWVKCQCGHADPDDNVFKIDQDNNE